MSAPTTPTSPDGLTFEQAWAEIVAQHEERLLAMMREVFHKAEAERQQRDRTPVTQDVGAIREASRKARKLKEQVDALAAEAVALDAGLSEERKARLLSYPFEGARVSWVGTLPQADDGCVAFILLTEASGRLVLRLPPREMVTLFETMISAIRSGQFLLREDDLDYVRRAVGSWPIQSETSAMSGLSEAGGERCDSEAANAAAAGRVSNSPLSTRPLNESS